MKKLLRAEGIKVFQPHATTLIRKMAIKAFYRKKNVPRRHPGHNIFPYLLRRRPVTKASEIWALDITYIPIVRAFVYSVGPMKWVTRKILSWPLPNTFTADFCLEPIEGRHCPLQLPRIRQHRPG